MYDVVFRMFCLQMSVAIDALLYTLCMYVSKFVSAFKESVTILAIFQKERGYIVHGFF